jgi:hypothetical protein
MTEKGTRKNDKSGLTSPPVPLSFLRSGVAAQRESIAWPEATANASDSRGAVGATRARLRAAAPPVCYVYAKSR